MKAKNVIAMILAGVSSVSLLAGCGASKTAESSTASSAAQTEAQSSAADTTAAESSEQAESNTEESAENTADKTNSETGKTLVVYYSASGNTERVAKAEAAGADLFEIVPVEPYTSDDLNWTNDNSRVSREHDDESLRNVELVSTEVENWDSYDTVLIGYPIWWGHRGSH